jgi:YegS/Rv2252/BmrU family lipid kinase
VNPAAGGGRCGQLADKALAELRASGMNIEQVHTASPGDGQRLARDAYRAGIRQFIAVGGDGTGYELVNGLLPEALAAAPADRPCLGFLPLGTGNSFLRDFGTGNLAQASAALVQGRRRPCDVVRLQHDQGALYFINLLSLGFVANVCTTANQRWKRLGAAGYGVAVVFETLGLAPRRIRMRVDGGPCWEQDITFVSFCNSRFTGGTMMMAPFADTADGQLDVIVAGAMQRLALLRAFPRIFAGTHVHLPELTCSRARRVEFDVPEPLDLMIDGEVERHRPLALEALPQALFVSV